MPRPRGGDWLPDETAGWRDAGIDIVVSLLEPLEASQLGLDDEASAAAASGIEFRVFPIPDRGVPDSSGAAAELIAGIVNALDTGKSVVVHCRQSVGRSGLIAGATLIAAGLEADAAIAAVSTARGLQVPETDDQRRWLFAFATK